MSSNIYGCSNDHWICELCLSDERMTQCPSCREDFKRTEPCRRRTAERIMSLLVKHNTEE